MSSRLNQAREVYSGESTSRPDGRLDVAVQHLLEENNNFYGMSCELASLADRLLGPLPPSEGVSKAVPQAVPNGTVDALHEQIGRFADTCGYLRRQLSRLNEIG